MKTCRICHVEKPLIEFYKRSDSADKHDSRCKSCEKLRHAKTYLENREKVSSKRKQYCENHKEEKALYDKEYRLNNIDKIKVQNKNSYEKNKQKVLERSKVWKKNNPASVLAKNSRSRAKKFSATPSWLTKDHKTFIEIQYQMAAFLTEQFGIKFHVDHIDPLKSEYLSGLHVPWNLQVIPAADNIRKSNKIIQEKSYVW
jgi:hypothetical protein